MAENTQIMDSGNQPVGKVMVLYGKVKAVATDGTERTLAPNSQIFMGDHIITGSDGMVSIVFDADQTQLDLGRMSDAFVDQDVIGGEFASAAADMAAEVEDIQQALIDGDIDQILDLPAPAAGGIISGAGGSREIVKEVLDNDAVLPEFGLETNGIEYSFLDPDGGGPPGEEQQGLPPEDTPEEEDNPEETPPSAEGSSLLVNEAQIVDSDSLPTLNFTAGSDPLVSFAFSDDLSGLITNTDGKAGADVNWVRVSDTLIQGKVDGKVALTLTLNAPESIAANTSGTVTVTATLTGAFPHPDGSGAQTISLGGIGVIGSEADGDFIEAPVTIAVIDDVPSITFTTEPGVVEEEALSTADGHDNLSDGNPDDDAANDIPGNNDPTHPVTQGTLSVAGDYGADGPGSIAINIGMDTSALPQLYSKGDLIEYNVSGNTLTATADGRTVFTLELTDNGDGTVDYTFTLNDQLDHVAPDSGSEENIELVTGQGSLAGIDFAPIISATITDADGDTATVSPDNFIITVEDDSPTLQGSGIIEFVEEEMLDNYDPDHNSDGDNLEGSSGNPDDSGAFDTPFGEDSATAEGSLSGLVSVGADEHEGGGAKFSFSDDYQEALSSANADLSSKDSSVNTYTLDGDTITASTEDGREVFTLELQENGDYTFTLLDQLDHVPPPPGTAVENALLINFSPAIEATDYDGDSVNLGDYTVEGDPAPAFQVRVEDDIPEAKEPSTSPKDLNLMLILDSSGSIDWEEGRLDALQDSVNDLLEGIADGSIIPDANNVRVHIVTFGPEAQTVGTYDIKIDGEGQVVQAVEITPEGTTNYEDAMHEALSWAYTNWPQEDINDLIPNTDPDDGPMTGDNVVNQVMFLSDGMPNTINRGDGDDSNPPFLGNDPEDRETAMDHARGEADGDSISEINALKAWAASGGVEAVGIEITEAGAMDLLDEISTSGTATNATDASDLSALLPELLLMPEGQPIIQATVAEDGLDSDIDESPTGNEGDDNTTGYPESGETTTDDEYSGTSAEDNLNNLFTAGADEELTFNISENTDGLPTLWSDGQKIHYSVNHNPDGADTLTASTDDGKVAFTLTVEENGEWSFDLDKNLDHVDNGLNNENTELLAGDDGVGNPDSSVTGIDLSTVIVAQDADGDEVAANEGTFVMKVEDDIPVAKEVASSPEDINLLLILDSSGSIGWEPGRLEGLEDSVNTLLSGISDGSVIPDSQNVRVHVVTFGPEGQAVGTYDIKVDGEGQGAPTIEINPESPTSTTNYEDAMHVALDWAYTNWPQEDFNDLIPNEAADGPMHDDGVVNQVLFLTDGMPNTINRGDGDDSDPPFLGNDPEDRQTAMDHATGDDPTDLISEVDALKLWAASGGVEAVGIEITEAGAMDLLNEISTDGVATNVDSASDLIALLPDLLPEGEPIVQATVMEDGLDSIIDESPTGLEGNDSTTGNPESGETTSADEHSGVSTDDNLNNLFESGADQELTFTLSENTDDLATLWSGGEKVSYSVTNNPDGPDVLTATTTDGTVVFTLTVEQNGEWSFDLDKNLDHANNYLNDENIHLLSGDDGKGKPDSSIRGIDLSSIIVAQDTDGDEVAADTGTFVITVEDDVPDIDNPQNAVLFNEAGNQVTADLDIDSFGADGAAENAIQFTGLTQGGYAVDNNGELLTANGENIIYQDDGSGGLEAITESNNDVVFTISTDQNSGTYTVNIVGDLDTPDIPAEGEGTEQTVTYTVEVTDADGDTDSSTVDVTFDNDHVIEGSDESDAISGSTGDDIIYGGDGDDTIYGGDGNDILVGGEGDDIIYGGDDDDVLFGDEGDDTLSGDAGDDQLVGGADNEDSGGTGDTMDGGEGNDQIFAGDETAGDGADTVTGGEDYDTADGVTDVNNDDVPDTGEADIVDGTVEDLDNMVPPTEPDPTV